VSIVSDIGFDLTPISSFFSAFGFLAGQEVMDTKVANLGTRDRESSILILLMESIPEILGMAWIQTQISKFGEDPGKVTL
jgi:hypothetical protein